MTTLNRAQRRALKKAPKAKPKSKWAAPANFTFRAIFNNQPYEEEIDSPVDLGDSPKDWMLRITNRHRTAMQKLRDGTADINDADTPAIVGEMIATGAQRAKEISGSETSEISSIFTDAAKSLKAVYTRRNRFAKWEVLDSEWKTFLEAADAFGEIMRLSTPNQMKEACRRSFDFWNTAKDNGYPQTPTKQH